MKKLSVFIATFFYTGYFPVAPGTFASLITAGIYLILSSRMVGATQTTLWIIAVGTSLVSIVFSDIAERVLGHDDGRIVIDEVCGYLVATLMLPQTILTAALAFVLFRFFDIVKPFPVKQLQKLTGGMGITADDLMAGTISNIILQILYRFVL